MRVAVISDTHDLLRPELLAELQQAEAIIHAGDICSEEVVTALRAIAPLSIVRGNNDKGAWADAIPETLDFTVGGVSIFMIHDRKQLPCDLPRYDLVIHGHSHRPVDEVVDGQRYLNPGSCGPRRFSLPVSMAWLTVGGDSFSIEAVELL